MTENLVDFSIEDILFHGDGSQDIEVFWETLTEATSKDESETSASDLGLHLRGRAKLCYDWYQELYGSTHTYGASEPYVKALVDMFGNGPLQSGRISDTERQFRAIAQGSSSLREYVRRFENGLKTVRCPLRRDTHGDWNRYNRDWFVCGLNSPLRERVQEYILYNGPASVSSLYPFMVQTQNEIDAEAAEEKRRELAETRARTSDEALQEMRTTLRETKELLKEAKASHIKTEESLKDTQACLREMTGLLKTLVLHAEYCQLDDVVRLEQAQKKTEAHNLHASVTNVCRAAAAASSTPTADQKNDDKHD